MFLFVFWWPLCPNIYNIHPNSSRSCHYCIYCSTPFLSHLAQLNEDEATYINGVVYIYLFVLLWLVWICSHASDDRLMQTITSDSISFHFPHWKMSSLMICSSNIFSLAGTLKWVCWQNGCIHKTRKSNTWNWLRRMTSTLDERKEKKNTKKIVIIRNIGSSHWLECYMEEKTPQSIQRATDVVCVFCVHFCSLLLGALDIQYSTYVTGSLGNLFMSSFSTSPSTYTMFKHLGKSRARRQFNMAVGISGAQVLILNQLTGAKGAK